MPFNFCIGVTLLQLFYKLLHGLSKKEQEMLLSNLFRLLIFSHTARHVFITNLFASYLDLKQKDTIQMCTNFFSWSQWFSFFNATLQFSFCSTATLQNEGVDQEIKMEWSARIKTFWESIFGIIERPLTLCITLRMNFLMPRCKVPMSWLTYSSSWLCILEFQEQMENTFEVLSMTLLIIWQLH